MIIEKKNTADLLPAEYNPRKDLKPGDAEYEKLKRSIEQFGYVEPVIWNKTTGRVVGGHQRLKVLIDMGITEVDCVVVELSEEKEKALNIALNKISGEWDKEKLALLITDLQGADFDVSLTGFEPAELDDLFKDSMKDGIKDDDFDVESELKKPTITKPGDIWTLGRHRLICGDSTLPHTYEMLMSDTKANLVITDPPYNVNYEGSAGKIKNDNMENDAFYGFLFNAFVNMEHFMADDASISFSMRIPKDSTSVRRSPMQDSTCPERVSGRNSPWFWGDPHTSGNMSRCCSDGRKKESICGTPVGKNRRSGSSTSLRKTAIIQP